jgi:hypothetical protein
MEFPLSKGLFTVRLGSVPVARNREVARAVEAERGLPPLFHFLTLPQTTPPSTLIFASITFCTPACYSAYSTPPTYSALGFRILGFLGI